jgi:uncharacterized membrane protein
MESHTRTIVRTVSYRLVALLITALWTGLGDAVAIHIVLALVQYIMERLWLKVKWGTDGRLQLQTKEEL